MKNRMMNMPVVQEDVLNFMRTGQKQLSGKVGELQAVAKENGVPVIPHETVVFMQFLLGQLQPKKILEVGTAIGFSASLMAEIMNGQGHVTTIDRFDVMIEKAKKNFDALGISDQVTLLEGQAADILPTLEGPYDFVFMDSAKSKYIEFLPECLRLVKTGGVIMIDDVLQAGTIFQPIEEIHRSQRAIHRKLNELFDKVMSHPDLTASLVPLGDGVLLITKNKDDVTI
ncbi:O-methyltransferase [Vagococcus coleopterorum]|uniref:tRNA 5-hydroxyuridine methyltransferase n=1 Tax=Vagococcus coleopterorum TaxID=2714946 RepID=A0A6G8AKN4_9ENTE|nr:O-methyltransferase [Vagococcus coleopterorum]QIL45618.1 O-methyltransferase [Vagococcus coleopterorum]